MKNREWSAELQQHWHRLAASLPCLRSSGCDLLLVLKLTLTLLGQAASNQGHSPQNCGNVFPCLNLTLPRPPLVDIALTLPWG